MIEVLTGIVLSLILALYIVFKAWQKDAERLTEAEEMVRAHEALQKMDDDIANGGDVFIDSQLLDITRDRDLHGSKRVSSDDIGA